MKKQLLILLCILTGFVGMRAQTGNFVANYTYSTTIGTYVALTTPTVLGSGSALDQETYTVTGLPSFTINGSAYTTAYVKVNGFLTLGSAASSTNYSPLSSSETYSAVISAFSRDLSGIDATTEISYAVVGSEIVFQWKNFSRYLVTGEALNFQIRINTTDGKIRIVYGACTGGSSTSYPQVGLRGASNTWTANVNALVISNTTGNCDWTNALTAPSNSSIMYYNTTNSLVAIPNGLTYEFTPATLTPPVRAFTAATSVTSSSVVLNFTQPAGTPTGYNVQYRVNNTCVWTNAVGNPFAAAATITLTGLNFNTPYQYRIQSITAAGNSIFSHVGTFTTLGLPCVTPTAQPTALTLSGTLGTAVNGTFTAATPTVSNYLVIVTTGAVSSNPVDGTTYTVATAALGGTIVSVGSGTTFANTGRVGNTNYAYYIYSYNNTGCVGGPLYNTTSPLTSSLTTCPSAPGTATVSGLSAAAFNLNWGSSVGGGVNPVTYTLDVSTVNNFTSAIVGSPFVVSTNSTSISGLTANTQYFYRIMASNGCSTVYTSTASVTTLCNATITFPYSEGFDATTLPSCWSVSQISGTNTWTTHIGTSDNDGVPAARTGARFAGKSYTNSDGLLISPPFNLSSLGSNPAWVNLWIYRNSSSAAADRIRVHLNTTNSLSGATQILEIFPRTTVTPTVSANGWYNYTANIPVSFNSGGPFYVLIQGTTSSGFSSYGIGFDDFILEQIPTCYPPTALTTTNITNSSVEVSWTAPVTGTTTAYNYEIRTSGAAGTGTTGLALTGTVTAPTNSVQVTGLYSGTSYSVYVKSDCGSGDLSSWSAAKTFSTVTTCTVPTNVVVSGISNMGAVYSWTSTATAFDLYYGTSPLSVPFGGTLPTATTSATSYTASGLAVSTPYALYVRAQCGSGDMSTWTAIKTFTTLCNPLSTFPYTESFSSTFPSCWAVSEGTTGASQHWESVTADASYGVAGPQAGTNFMRLNVFSASKTYNTYNLISPSFSLPATPQQISYKYFLGNNGYKGTSASISSTVDPYPLSLQVSTDYGLTWTTVYSHSSSNSVFSTSSSTVNWQSNTVILGAYTNQTAQFRFVSNSNFDSGTCNQGLDEIVINDAPACAPPTVLTTTNTLGYSTNLSWTAPSTGTPANYIWEVRTSGAAGSGTTGIVATGTVTAPTTSVLVAGLTPTTAYSAYVSTDCGGGLLSAWTPEKTFTTTVSCPAPTSLTINNIMPTAATASWSAGATETSWYVQYATPTTTAAASTPSYSLSGLSASTNYTVSVKAVCATTNDSSVWVTKTFATLCQPADITGFGSTRCGVGTTTLMATSTSTSAVINWYSNATGGSSIATGTVFTTPTITSNATYYATSTDGLVNSSFGPSSPSSQGGTISSSSVDWQMNFNVTQNTTLLSVDIFPTAAIGSVGSIKVTNSTDVLISDISYTTTVTGGSLQTILLNIPLSIGTGYKIRQGTAISLNRNTSSAVYPYTSSVISITGNGFDPIYYYYFYNWQVTSGCESPRVPVTATVTAPPALALTTGTTVCSDVIAPLTITSTLSDYDSYIWSPATNLYTDAAATTAYTGGSATTVYYKSTLADTKLYTVNATSSVSGCGNISTTTMVTDVPVILANITPTAICSASTVTLNATTNAIITGTTSVGSGSSTSAASPTSPFNGAYGGMKAQYLITAADLMAGGVNAGNITSLALGVTVAGSPLQDFAISMGTTTLNAFGTNTDLQSGLSSVYSTTLFTPVVGNNVFTFSTPFNWDGTSNIIVSTCWSNSNSSNTSSAIRSVATAYRSAQSWLRDNASASAICALTGTITNFDGGSTALARPQFIFGGQVNGQGAGSLDWSWNPGSINSNTAIVNPVNTGTTATTMSYTITGTNPLTTCSNTSIASVLVNPVPVAVVANNSTQCGYGIPTASVTGMGGTYNWYNAATSGTLVQSGTSATYTTAINNTTTFYVAENNGNCEGPLTPVTVTVTTADAITTAISSTTICPAQTVTLTATNTGTNQVYAYTWVSAANNGIASSVNNATATATPSLAGVYEYTVVGNDGACNAIATTSLTVITPPMTPTIVPANPVICAGGTVNLTALGGVVTNTLISENFEGGTLGIFNLVNLPSHTAGSAAEWKNQTSPVTISSQAINSGSKFVNANSDASSSGQVTNTSLETAVLNTVGYTGLSLNFSHYLRDPFSSNQTAFIEASTDGGTTWTTVQSYGGGTSVGSPTLFANGTVNLNSYVNNSNLKLRFYFNVTWQYSWSIDNVSLVGSSPVPSVSYSWAPSTGLSATTGVNVIGNPSVTSTYTVVANDGVCSSAPTLVTVTVNPIPNVTATTANSVVCLGSSATLVGGGATTYTWLPQGGQFATTVITPTATTVYTVTGTSLGCSNTATVELVSAAVPSVSATATPTNAQCAGTAITLNATGATTYTWLPTGGNTATASVSPMANTVYTVTGSNGSCSAKSTVTVNVIANPTVTATSSKTLICTSESAVLTASSSATSYTWSSNASSATTTTVTVSPTTTTNYTVTVSNGTCTASAAVSVSVSPCTGIEELSSNNISVYPNPTNGIVNIAITNELITNAVVEMYDAVGKLVIRETLTRQTSSVNMNRLEDGVYFYKIISDNQEVKIGKLIKQ